MTHSVKSGSKGLRIALLFFLFASYGMLALLPDLRTGIPEMLAITAFASAMVAVIFYLSEKSRGCRSPVFILLMAACFRMLFLFQEPQLSDDIHRYLFDGVRLSMRANPYDMPPDQAAQLNAEIAELADRVNHSHLVTIYPPAAQILFAGSVMLGFGIIGIKLVLFGMDLLCIFLMMRLLATLNLSPDRVVLYAWHPLAVLETASSGHIDSAAVMFVMAGVCLVHTAAVSAGLPGRVAALAGGGLFAVAVLIKLFPVIFLPLLLFLLRDHRKSLFLAGFAFAGGLLVLPFCPDIQNALTTLDVYITTWEFSGLAFRLFRNLLESGFWARIVLGSVFAVFWVLCFRWAVSEKNRTVPAEDFFLRVLQAFCFISFAFLVITPTLHPWYGIYMLAFLPFSPVPAGLILSWTILLGYQVLIPYAIMGEWIESDFVPVLIWAGPAAAWILGSFFYHQNKCFILK